MNHVTFIQGIIQGSLKVMFFIQWGNASLLMREHKLETKFYHYNDFLKSIVKSLEGETSNY